RDAVLVAIHDKARSFLRRLGVNHAAEFDALLVGVRCVGGDVLLLIGDDADSPSTDARIPTKQRFAILGTVFVEGAAIGNAGNDLTHIVLLRGIARENAVEVAGGVQRLVQAGM